MTLESAKATAIGMTSRFCADFAVFRLPAWPVGVYTVRRQDELPSNAAVAAVFTVSAAAAPATPTEGGQGSLF